MANASAALPAFLTLVLAAAAADAQGPATSGTVPFETLSVGPGQVHTGEPVDVPQPPRALLPVLPPRGRVVVPYEPGTLPQPASPPGSAAVDSPIAAPGDLRFWRNVTLSQRATAFPPEPSTTLNRDTGLLVFNTRANLTRDQGQTWTVLNPATMFPAIDAGACCDQRVIHGSRGVSDLTIWFIQYSRSSTTRRGSVRIAVAVGRNGLRANTWRSWVFDPQDFNQPLDRWFDYPDIAVSSNHLYCSSNVFDFSGNYTNSVVWRMRLADLWQGSISSVQWATRNTPGSSSTLGARGSYRFTQEAGSNMCFASHSSTSRMRVFVMSDSGSSATWYDRGVPGWSDATRAANAPNGINWLGNEDSRIHTGYYDGAHSEYGFLWSCAQDSGHPYPFIRVARFRTSDNGLIDAQDIWNGSYGISYSGAAVNLGGDKGVVFAAGGPNLHVRSGAFLVDAYHPAFYGQVWQFMSSPGRSPASPRWGDYFTCEKNPDYSTFIGSGALVGNDGQVYSQHVQFGREANEPTWPTLTVNSSPITGVPVTLDVTDRFGNSSGNTNFTRSFGRSQGYRISTPTVHTVGNVRYVFSRWTSSNGTYTTPAVEVSAIGLGGDAWNARYDRVNRLSVRSTNPSSGVPITVSATDVNGNRNGVTPFDRDWRQNTVLTLTAPASIGANVFRHWTVNDTFGGRIEPNRVVSITMAGVANFTANAVYWERVPGALVSFGSACMGSNGRLFGHTAAGTPEIGRMVTHTAHNALPLANLWLLIGLSNTNFNGIPLPFDNAPIGAPGCFTYCSHDVVIPTNADFSGTASVPITWTNDENLIGLNLYSQYYSLDVAANQLGLTMSNAYRTLLGGLR